MPIPTYLLDKDHPAELREQVRANAIQAIKDLPNNKSYRLTIKRAVKERTNDQNAALFGLAYKVLGQSTGYTNDELHDAFCKRFFGSVDRKVFGIVTSVPFRTTTTNEYGDLDVIPAEEFARFYDMVQDTGAEAGIKVPDPDPTYKLRRSGRWRA
jgi:hypothetical protein